MITTGHNVDALAELHVGVTRRHKTRAAFASTRRKEECDVSHDLTIMQLTTRSTIGHCAFLKRCCAYRPAEWGRYTAYRSFTAT